MPAVGALAVQSKRANDAVGGLSAVSTRVGKMVKDNIGYNVSPMGYDNKYSKVGANGTFVTDRKAIEDVIGPMGKLDATKISPKQVAQLEKALGLKTGTLRDGFKIREIKDIVGKGAQAPTGGNSKFRGTGNGLPSGGPELKTKDSISTKDGNGVKSIFSFFGFKG